MSDSDGHVENMATESQTDLNELKVSQLRRILERNGIRFPSKVRKSVLIKAIMNHGLEEQATNLLARVTEAERAKKKRPRTEDEEGINTASQLKRKKNNDTKSDPNVSNIDGRRLDNSLSSKVTPGNLQTDSGDSRVNVQGHRTRSDHQDLDQSQTSVEYKSPFGEYFAGREDFIKQMTSPSHNITNGADHETNKINETIGIDENATTKEVEEVDEEIDPEKKETVDIEHSGIETSASGVSLESFETPTYASPVCLDSWKKDLLQVGIMLLVFIFISFALWYHQQKFRVGYCGHELPVQNIVLGNNPNRLQLWLYHTLENIAPKCQPCPEYAVCRSLREIRCLPGYNLQRSTWSLAGLLPLFDRCVLDDTLQKKLYKGIMEFLSHNKQALEENSKFNAITQGVALEVIYETFLKQRPSWMSESEFSHLWVKVITKVKQSAFVSHARVPSIDQGSDFNFGTEFIWMEGMTSTNIMKLLKGFFFSGENKWFWLFMIYFAFIAGIAQMIMAREDRNSQKLQVGKLVNDAIEKLKTHKLDETRDVDYLNTFQLREYLFTEKNQIIRNNKLWDKVSETLEKKNNAVRCFTQEQTGEIIRYWEWVGHEKDE